MSGPVLSSWCRLLLAFPVSAVGCGKDISNPDSVGPAPPVAQVGPPLTEADYRQFGEKLESAVATGDKDEVDRLIRIRSLAERSISDLDLAPDLKKGVLFGAKEGYGGRMAEYLIELSKAGGSYSFLRVRTVDGHFSSLLRVLPPEGGFNYHEITLVRYPDGHIAP